MLNHIVLMGRLTRDPELRRTGTGLAVATFSLAVDRDFGNRESGERETDFIDIVAWRHTAEFVAKYFTKGQLVAVEGSIQTRSYQDKDGNNRTAFEVVADQVYFAERKAGGTTSNAGFVPPPFEEPAKGSSFSVGDLGDFEEFDADDSDLPF